MNESEHKAVLLFDGDCAFCTKSAAIGQWLHLECDFTSLQSVDLEYLNIDPARAQHEVPLYDGRGAVLYGHEAVAAVLKTGALPLRTLGHVITSRLFNRLAAWAYRVVSRHRHQLPGGTSTCKLDS